MRQLTLTLLLSLTAFSQVGAQTMTFSTSSADYQVTPVFSNVDFFTISVEIDATLAAGVYVDPPISNVTYQVTGVLAPGTPSGFPAFDLQRTMTGTEFYAQGSSLSFEIANFAVLTDGVQAVELVGAGLVLTFNGREIDNGRFHPALFELDMNGTGRIQNSNNIPTLVPLLEVDFGAEYITDLVFDPGNTTLITGPVTVPPVVNGGGGGGAMSVLALASLLLLGVFRLAIRRRTGVRQHAGRIINRVLGQQT